VPIGIIVLVISLTLLITIQLLLRSCKVKRLGGGQALLRGQLLRGQYIYLFVQILPILIINHAVALSRNLKTPARDHHQEAGP
jgi:hypothetical protein